MPHDIFSQSLDPLPSLPNTVPASLLADHTVFPDQSILVPLYANPATPSLIHHIAAHLQSGYRFCRSHSDDGSSLLHAIWLGWSYLAAYHHLPCPHILELHNWIFADPQRSYPLQTNSFDAHIACNRLSETAYGCPGSVGILLFTQRSDGLQGVSVSMPLGDCRVSIPVFWNGLTGIACNYSGISWNRDILTTVAQCDHLQSSPRPIDYSHTPMTSALRLSVASLLGSDVLTTKPPRKAVRDCWLTMVYRAWQRLQPLFTQYHKVHRHQKYERPPNFPERQHEWRTIQRFEKRYMSDEDVAYAWMQLLGHGPWSADREQRLSQHGFMRLVDFGCLLHDYTNGVTKEWQRKQEYLVKLSRGERPAGFKHHSRLNDEPFLRRANPGKGAQRPVIYDKHPSSWSGGVRGPQYVGPAQAQKYPEVQLRVDEVAPVTSWKPADMQDQTDLKPLDASELEEWDKLCREAAQARGELI